MSVDGHDRWLHRLLDIAEGSFASIEEAAASFASDEFVVLRGMLEPFETNHLHKHYQAAMSMLPNKEPFVTSCVNERLGYFYNQRFRPMVSALAELPVQPAYR